MTLITALGLSPPMLLRLEMLTVWLVLINAYLSGVMMQLVGRDNVINGAVIISSLMSAIVESSVQDVLLQSVLEFSLART
jgi:hypothetical protein